MAVRLVSATKRFIGSSADEKPLLEPRDAGSTFLATDTRTMHYWTGTEWQAAPSESPSSSDSYLSAILTELQEQRVLLEALHD